MSVCQSSVFQCERCKGFFDECYHKPHCKERSSVKEVTREHVIYGISLCDECHRVAMKVFNMREQVQWWEDRNREYIIYGRDKSDGDGNLKHIPSGEDAPVSHRLSSSY